MLGLFRAPLVHLTSGEVGSPPALDWWIRGRFSRCSLGSGAVAGAAVPGFVTALTATILPSQAEPTACCLHRVSGLYLTPLGLINRLLLIKMRAVPDPPLSFFCLPFWMSNSFAIALWPFFYLLLMWPMPLFLKELYRCLGFVRSLPLGHSTKWVPFVFLLCICIKITLKS